MEVEVQRHCQLILVSSNQTCWYILKAEEVIIRLKPHAAAAEYASSFFIGKNGNHSESIKENKNKPWIIFSTVAKLKESRHSIQPDLPKDLTSNNFIYFFNNKIVLIRETITCLSDSSSITGTIERVVIPDIYLESFSIQMMLKS